MFSNNKMFDGINNVNRHKTFSKNTNNFENSFVHQIICNTLLIISSIYYEVLF